LSGDCSAVVIIQPEIRSSGECSDLQTCMSEHLMAFGSLYDEVCGEGIIVEQTWNFTFSPLENSAFMYIV
jgi:hypothetical protein